MASLLSLTAWRWCLFITARRTFQGVMTVPLQQSHDSGLARDRGALVRGLAGTLVHEASKPTDERLVNLNIALDLRKGLGLHRQPDAVEHEPRGLLGDPKGAVQLVATDPVLGIDQQPNGGQPLVQADRGILEDRAQLDAELLLAALALPNATGLEEGVLLGPTNGAGHSIGPAQASQEVQGHVGIGEVLNGTYEVGRNGDGLVHTPKVAHSPWCVKYVIAS
jgi:hypothetical protein